MTRPWTVQCGYYVHYANTVTVKADTLEEALDKALAAANNDPSGWRGTDHVTDTHVDSCCEGANTDPWGEGALSVPDRFTERGEPPLVSVRIGADGRPAARVEGGKARIRILDG